MSDDDSPMSDSANLADISGEAGDNSTCDTYMDTDLSDTGVTTPKRRSKMKIIIPSTLRKGYYGRKRFRRGHRHYVSSVIEYTAGSTLGASARNILFHMLLMSAYKPNNKNKNFNHQEAFVLCNTGASISLEPLRVAEGLGMRIDKSELVSIRGADGKKIKVVGTSYVYMRDKASPSWRRVKVVVTESGNNFLLSCSDLKNLDLMSKSFPEYTGKVRSAKADADLEEILNKPFDDELTRETGDCIAPQVQEEIESN